MAGLVTGLPAGCVATNPTTTRSADSPPGAAAPLAEPVARARRQIADARARSNAAIAAHDTAGIAAEWWPDVHVVASTGAQVAGAAANAQRMAEQFARRPDTRYVRSVDDIQVWLAWGVASERGHWVGTWTDPDGPVRIEGTYQAQWRMHDDRWRVQAELFVPLVCRGGAYCRAHP
jgi:ketosteroid isomerase-like protein